MRTLALWFLGISLSSVADAQSFGVEMGAPISRYAGQITSTGNPYYFRVKVPQPNREFESYIAVATPETGICKVSAIGRDHANDDYGTDVQQAFSGLKAALARRYGSSKDFDYLKSGAIWDAPREWIWSIYKDERVVASYWDHEERSAMPSGVQAISLKIKSVNPSKGAYVTLNYEFDNFDRCWAIVKQNENQGL